MTSEFAGDPPVPGPRPGYWFPLLLFGGLAALSPPLYVLASPPLPTGMAVFTRVVYPNVAEAMYLGGGSANPPFSFPLGWYWVGVLIAGFLLTAAWYRWRDRRTGGRTPLRGYLGLALLAWQTRSLALAVITAVYAVAVCFAGWFDLQQAIFDPAFFPLGDPTVLLPAAVLVFAGLGVLKARTRTPIGHGGLPRRLRAGLPGQRFGLRAYQAGQVGQLAAEHFHVEPELLGPLLLCTADREQCQVGQVDRILAAAELITDPAERVTATCLCLLHHDLSIRHL